MTMYVPKYYFSIFTQSIMVIAILLKESIHIWLVKWSMKVNVVVKVYKKIKLGHCPVPPGPFIRFIRHTTFSLMIL